MLAKLWLMSIWALKTVFSTRSAAGKGCRAQQPGITARMRPGKKMYLKKHAKTYAILLPSFGQVICF